MNMKVCNGCKEEKFDDQFYNFRSKICKNCLLIRDRKKRVSKRQLNGGSERVPQKPNEWADEFQMEQTHQFLELIGYKQNKENNIWYKLPWKTEDAQFPLLPTTIKNRGKIQYKIDDINKWIELRQKGYTYVKISEMFDVNKETIRHFVIKYLTK